MAERNNKHFNAHADTHANTHPNSHPHTFTNASDASLGRERSDFA